MRWGSEQQLNWLVAAQRSTLFLVPSLLQLAAMRRLQNDTSNKLRKPPLSHLTNNKRAIENNRKYLQSSTRAKKGHQLRNLRCYYRRKLKQAQIVDSAGKNMTPYINKCKNKVKELSEKLQSLGYRPWNAMFSRKGQMARLLGEITGLLCNLWDRFVTFLWLEIFDDLRRWLDGSDERWILGYWHKQTSRLSAVLWGWQNPGIWPPFEHFFPKATLRE